MDKEKFMMDLAALNSEIMIDNDGELSVDNFLDKINQLIDKYAP